MRKILLAGVATGALIAGPALAADMPVYKAPPPPPPMVYNWTGFYIGAHVGGGFGTKDWFDNGDPLGSHDTNGFIAGGQIGFNWQSPSNWVLGLEADISWADLTGDHTDIFGQKFSSKVEWLGTVTGRLGYAFDRVLVYAKGGFAFAHDKFDFARISDPSRVASGDTTRTGWTVGGGIEVALGGNWSAKGEYQYLNFGSDSVDLTFPDNNFTFPLDIDQEIHVVKFGINYRFGPWSAPVAARY
ncbi:MAG: outer membrane beta-barrel protein [Rhizobiales bacterium]|nr:outer membrane beta-barrel protein [Hyphomicrobiales bacterium]